MIGEFGKILRKIRIDAGELMLHMAEKLDVSAAYLSAVETLKRPVPKGWTEKIRDFYSLSDEDYVQLCNARDRDAQEIVVGLYGVKGSKQQLALSFARDFSSLHNDTVEEMLKILKEGRKR